MNRDVRICFIGDSLINGTGDESALGWAGRLCAAANSYGHCVTYYNLGVRRDTTRDILRRWRNECEIRLPPACDGRIVLSCGINDTVVEDGSVRIHPEESRANVREILRGTGKHRMLMVGPPPVDDANQNERILALSRAFAREAELLDIPYIDLFTPLASDDAYRQEVSNNDGAHPKTGGYDTIARIVGSSPNWWFRAHRGAGPAGS